MTVNWVNVRVLARTMLRKIHIQDFRLCKDVLIDGLSDVTALVGRNGAGKTNILQAIDQTARAATSNNSAIIQKLYTLATVFSATLEFDIGDSVYRYTLSIPVSQTNGKFELNVNELLDRKNGEDWITILKRQVGTVQVGDQTLQIGKTVPSLPAVATVLPPDDEIVVKIKQVITFLSNIHYYPLDEQGAQTEPSGPVPESQYKAWLADRSAAGNDVLFRIIHMALERPDDLRILKDLLGPKGLGLIGGLVVHPISGEGTGSSSSSSEGMYYLVYFSPMRGQGVVPLRLQYGALSSGTRRVLRILASLLFDGNSVMLLEQPEDSLHQGLTKRLIDLLRTNADPSQLIISSHSSALLNKLKPEEIRLVSLRDGFTHVRSLSQKEVEIAIKFMNDDGPLYDFLDTVQEH